MYLSCYSGVWGVGLLHPLPFHERYVAGVWTPHCARGVNTLRTRGVDSALSPGCEHTAHPGCGLRTAPGM